MTNLTPEPAQDSLERNIRTTVAISVLRRLRGLVDDYEEERRTERRVTRAAIAVVVIGCVAALVLTLTGQWGAVLRTLSAAIA